MRLSSRALSSHGLAPMFAAVSALAGSLAFVPDATACGGSFSEPSPSQTVDVTSHRMILSISQTQSTLYDQILYTGSPDSFAWVLPIKGTVTVGVSSDALFGTLDQLTAPTVSAPFDPSCNCPDDTGNSSGFTGTGSGTGGGLSVGGGVTVVAQSSVGPYETVQLASTDPTALSTWLSMNGYAIPASIQPTITAYVNGGFNFLAVKLKPGTGIGAMQPISVTTSGASAVLPLRMVAAGAGQTVPITLWVVGEGRYEPTSFPTFTIDSTKLVWDFASNTSNYGQLMQAGFTATNGSGWLVQSAQPMSPQAIQSQVDFLVQTDPAESGYGDSMGNGAAMAEMADMMTLFNGIDPTSMFVTRMLAELPVTALSKDLVLDASGTQTIVPQVLTATQYVNAPVCPPCSVDVTGSGGAAGSGAAGTGGSPGNGSGGSSGHGTSSSCALAGSDDTSLAAGGLFAAIALASRRRRRRNAH